MRQIDKITTVCPGCHTYLESNDNEFDLSMSSTSAMIAHVGACFQEYQKRLRVSRVADSMSVVLVIHFQKEDLEQPK